MLLKQFTFMFYFHKIDSEIPVDLSYKQVYQTLYAGCSTQKKAVLKFQEPI